MARVLRKGELKLKWPLGFGGGGGREGGGGDQSKDEEILGKVALSDFFGIELSIIIAYTRRDF